MPTRWVLFAVAAIALAGCADDEQTAVRWSKPGASYDQFLSDRAACVEQTRQETQPFVLGGQRYGENGSQGGLDSSRFIPCMAAHGYRRDPNGFAAPRSEELPLAP